MLFYTQGAPFFDEVAFSAGFFSEGKIRIEVANEPILNTKGQTKGFTKRTTTCMPMLVTDALKKVVGINNKMKVLTQSIKLRGDVEKSCLTKNRLQL